MGFSFAPGLWSYMFSTHCFPLQFPIYFHLLLFHFPFTLVPQNLEWWRGGKKEGKWVPWDFHLISIFLSFLRVQAFSHFCAGKAPGIVELIVPCTTSGSAIHSVHARRSTRQWEWKETYHFGSSDLFLLHLTAGGYLFITLFRECYLKCNSLIHLH